MSDETIKKLEQRLSELETRLAQPSKPPRPPRAPSAYNTFMGEYIQKNKSAKKTHKELFAEAVKAWNAKK
jgi:hypothetical protein